MLIVLDFIYEYKLNLREGYGLHYGDGGWDFELEDNDLIDEDEA